MIRDGINAHDLAKTGLDRAIEAIERQVAQEGLESSECPLISNQARAALGDQGWATVRDFAGKIGISTDQLRSFLSENRACEWTRWTWSAGGCAFRCAMRMAASYWTTGSQSYPNGRFWPSNRVYDTVRPCFVGFEPPCARDTSHGAPPNRTDDSTLDPW